MLSDCLADVDSALLEKIVADRWPETSTLDFKAQLAGREQQDKHEFAKDVAGLANADGGDLVYGIQADDDGALGLAPVAGVPADREKMRLGQILDSQVEPRIHAVEMREIAMDGGYVLVVRVPASYAGPHAVTDDKVRRRFPLRVGTRITDMSFDQNCSEPLRQIQSITPSPVRSGALRDRSL